MLDSGGVGLEVLQLSGAPDSLLAVGDPEFPLPDPPTGDQFTVGRDVLVSSDGVEPEHASQ